MARLNKQAKANNNTMNSESISSQTETSAQPRRIIRRSKPGTSTASKEISASNALPPHLANNQHLRHIISTTLPVDYEFEILKTIDRIEKSRAVNVALQLPEGLLMYATTIGDILRKFSYANLCDESNKPQLAISILGDVTYGACCIDDLTALSLNADLLVHYGHSCLVPTTITAVPCLYVFVEIHVDVQHLVDCVRLTFNNQEESSQGCMVIECAVMGTVQFRSAVVEAARRLNESNGNEASDDKEPMKFQAIVPQAKPLSPGEVLGCTAPKGLANLDWKDAMMSLKERRHAKKQQHANRSADACVHQDVIQTLPTSRFERVMIFIADGRFHLEAAMISNPTLRALRYDPYSKTLTEEKYEIVKMKRLRREAVVKVRSLLDLDYDLKTFSSSQCRVGNESPTAQSSEDIVNSILSPSLVHQPSEFSAILTSSAISNTTPSQPKTIGIILGTLGRQGNPGILGKIRSLLHLRGVRTMIVLLSEIFPKKLEMLSGGDGGVCAWVQIACPRLSIDWGHYFCVPVLSPFELFVALGEVADSSLWSANDNLAKNTKELDGSGRYPMDFYSKAGGPWTNYFEDNKNRRVLAYSD